MLSLVNWFSDMVNLNNHVTEVGRSHQERSAGFNCDITIWWGTDIDQVRYIGLHLVLHLHQIRELQYNYK